MSFFFLFVSKMMIRTHQTPIFTPIFFSNFLIDLFVSLSDMDNVLFFSAASDRSPFLSLLSFFSLLSHQKEVYTLWSLPLSFHSSLFFFFSMALPIRVASAAKGVTTVIERCEGAKASGYLGTSILLLFSLSWPVVLIVFSLRIDRSLNLSLLLFRSL